MYSQLGGRSVATNDRKEVTVRKAQSKSVDFVEVDVSEIPDGAVRGRGLLSPASQALLDGKAIWMGGANRSARFSRMAKPRGFRVRTRTGERGGERGTYIWLERTEA